MRWFYSAILWLLPSLCLAFDVPVNLMWDAPTSGTKPTFYMVYMCDAPILSAWGGEHTAQSGPVGKCTGRMQIERVTDSPVALAYRTDLEQGTLYIRMTSGVMVTQLDDKVVSWESDLSNEFVGRFINKITLNPPLFLRLDVPDRALKLNIEIPKVDKKEKN